MELVGLFVLGLLIGLATGWHLQQRYRQDDMAERELQHEARVKQVQDELRQSDSVLAETKERLIALQLEQRQLEQRLGPLEDELKQSRRAAQQAAELEARLREKHQTLETELVRLKQGGSLPAAPATALPPDDPPVAAPTPVALSAPAAMSAPAALSAPAAMSAADDLTRIKGIGKVMQTKLHELGITSFAQIAELSGPEVGRINRAIDFPGRIEREHWIEQARSLSGG